MQFFLQFREAASDQPVQEISSPLPLPVPARGDEVKVYGESAADPVYVGVVQRVRWEYQPGAPGPGGEPSMDSLARVWLSPVSA